MPFDFKPLDALPDVILVEPRVFGDDRGWFMEAYKESAFAEHGIPHQFAQDNRSFSRHRGVLRGLHYQLPPEAQGKLVTCLRGAVWDVAVDIRRGSPTYGEWVAAELTAEDRRLLWVPPGFAHGFCTLTPGAEVAYKVTREYSPHHDRAIRWDDPDIGVEWPVDEPTLSEKDASAPLLRDAENAFEWRDVEVAPGAAGR